MIDLMKLFRLTLFAIITSLLAFVLPAQAKPKDAFQEGERVAAKWTDGKYYIGRIDKIGAKIQVKWDDGSYGPVPPKDIAVIPQNVEFAVGEHVLAVWKGAQMFPGVVTQVKPNQCIVKWDDGDQPSLVHKQQMVRWP
jgi:hypothetical protein